MTRKLILVAVLLVATLGLRFWLSAAPQVPPRRPLADFPAQIAGSRSAWTMVSQQRVGADVLAVLKPDDYLLRTYRDAAGANAGFFVAYYRSQKAGDAMHSPKNCLPGAGWEPVMNDRVRLATTPAGRPELANRYLVENEGNRMMVLYWYQAQGRIIASEYWGKFYLVWDAISQHRRDGALVRVTLPMAYGESVTDATQTALGLARASLPHLSAFLPD